MVRSEDKFILDATAALPINQIVCGDSLEVMKGFPPESIDLIATDPPYGYSFMGKDWDRAVPSVEVWRECLRVLKGGAFMFVMSAPRQDVLSQMIVRLGQAGFETGFTSIYWAYASGFPKASNISKMVDKKFDAKRERLGTKYDLLGHGKKAHGQLYHSDSDRAWIDNPDADCHYVSLPSTEKAKVLNGSYGGFQPKPAVEVIIVCMKPLSEKTFVDQALANGKGVTWLDNARIPYVSQEDKELAIPQGRITTRVGAFAGRTQEGLDKELDREEWKEKMRGRFPANLLVSDDVLNDGRIIIGSGHTRHNTQKECIHVYQKHGFKSIDASGVEDSGSFSRYFDLDKWFLKTVENLPESVKRTFPFLICPKASKSERNKGCENLEQGFITEQNKWSENDYRKGAGEKTIQPKGNRHPTVKPLKLMSYLVTLGSRLNDVVLDPFVGSGTTCMASEILNRKWIGIDINPEYCDITRKRLATVPEKLDGFMKVPEEAKT